MKTTQMLTLKRISGLIATVVILLASCQKESEILSSLDTQNVNSEAASAAFVNENSEMSTSVINAMSSYQYAGGRSIDIIPNLGDRDGRLKCATITVVRASTSTKDNPSGTITIEFNPTCSDNHGVTRKGKIIITYSGRRWMPGSTHSIQLVDFYRNSAHIEGKESDTTKLSTDSLHLKFVSWLVGGKVTFGDGRTIEREHNFIKTWYRALLPQNDEWHIEGSASGKNKNGNEYQMDIQSPLVHKVSCWVANKVCIPVKGIKTITISGSTGIKTYEVNYGDGTCDNLITVIVNGKEKVITVNNDGN